MRGALHAGTLLLACAALGSTRARAQSCHAPLGGTEPEGWVAGVTLDEATVAEPAGGGASYQSAALVGGYGAPRFELSALLPAHRLHTGLATHVGLGDAVLDARVAVLAASERERAARAPWLLGVELAASLPTGSRARRLGMGHVMWMPGLYARARDSRASLLAQAGYAWALGADHDPAGHDHAQGSLVDPMNASELTAALSLSLRIAEAFALLGSLAAASPLATEGGVARAAAGLGASWALPPLELALRLELPVIGAAFEQRVTLGVTLAP